MIESLRAWKGMSHRIGIDTGFNQSGVVYLARTISEMEAHDAWLENARRYEIDSQLISGRELDSLLPGSSDAYIGALFTKSDGRAEPAIAVPAMARKARQLGAIIVENTAARGVETHGGSVSSIVTERGVISCNSVLLAGGIWSRLFCRPLGIDLPQLKILSSVLRTHPIKGCPEVSTSGHGFSFRKRLDGGYTIAHGSTINYEIVPDSFRFFQQFFKLAWQARRELRPRLSRRFVVEWELPRSWALDRPGPFEQIRIMDPTPMLSELNQAMQNLVSTYPSFRDAQIAAKWAGYIDVVPDAVPIISPVSSPSGLYLATGFSGHGFGIGPGAGELAVDLITGSSPRVDPQPFVISRFFDRSGVGPVAGI
tara:strand:- start:347 stop:1450 length:1104 start_codon:yes stop_codon:yes gene_type:complete